MQARAARRSKPRTRRAGEERCYGHERCDSRTPHSHSCGRGIERRPCVAEQRERRSPRTCCCTRTRRGTRAGSRQRRGTGKRERQDRKRHLGLASDTRGPKVRDERERQRRLGGGACYLICSLFALAREPSCKRKSDASYSGADRRIGTDRDQRKCGGEWPEVRRVPREPRNERAEYDLDAAIGQPRHRAGGKRRARATARRYVLLVNGNRRGSRSQSRQYDRASRGERS